ncbi:MAG: hexose kinase [Alsobacter sp.]
MLPVVTYTPNPAIDSWARCDVVIPGEKTRVAEVRYDPGGGGVNVARALHEMGTPARPVYLAGGTTGGVFTTLLARAGLSGLCIPIADDTRISTVVFEAGTGREYRFVANGPQVSEAETAAALAALATEPASWIVASGSLPRGMPQDHYVAVARIAAGRGVPFALDTSGEALAACAAAGGFDLLKVSRRELETLTQEPTDGRAAAARAAIDLARGSGIRRILVSLGHEGAVLAHSDGAVTVDAPRVAVQSTVGAGDTFLAGFVHGLTDGMDDAEALAWAVAAGSAACFRPGTQLAQKADVETLRSGIGQALAHVRDGDGEAPGPSPRAPGPA